METGRESIDRLTSELRDVFDQSGRWGDLYLSLLSVFAANELERVCDGGLFAFEDDPEPVNIDRSPHNEYKLVAAFATDGEHLYYKDSEGRKRRTLTTAAYPTDLLTIVGLIETGRWVKRDRDVINGVR